MAKIYHNNSVDTASNDDKEQKTLVAGARNSVLDRKVKNKEVSAVSSFDASKGDDVDSYEAEDNELDYYGKLRKKTAEHRAKELAFERKRKTESMDNQIARKDKVHNHQRKLAEARDTIEQVNKTSGSHYGINDVNDELYDESVTASDFDTEVARDHIHERRELPEIKKQKQDENTEEYEGPGAKKFRYL